MSEAGGDRSDPSLMMAAKTWKHPRGRFNQPGGPIEDFESIRHGDCCRRVEVEGVSMLARRSTGRDDSIIGQQ